MADPITAAVITAAATLAVGAATATIGAGALVYNVGRDICAHMEQKGAYAKNLTKNYKMLKIESQKLNALAADMNSGSAMKEQNKDSSAFKLWLKRAQEVQAEVGELLKEYKSMDVKREKKKKRTLLSQLMEEKCKEVGELIKEAQSMTMA